MWSQYGADQRMTVSLTDIPSLGIALQSVWLEAAENGTKPGDAEYRNHRWEDRQRTSGRPVDASDANRMALVYIVESRDVAQGGYDEKVLAPLQGMVQDPALQGAVEPVLEWAKSRMATCDAANNPSRRFIPANKVVSIYVVGASRGLVPGSPFFNVSNFKYAWPLRVTIPLGYGIDLIEDVGFVSHLQGCAVRPFCNGSTAATVRSKVLERLLELQAEATAANDTAAAQRTAHAAADHTADAHAADINRAAALAADLLPHASPYANAQSRGASKKRRSNKGGQVTLKSPDSAASKHFSTVAQHPDEQPSFYERNARRGYAAPLNRYPGAVEASRATARVVSANRRAAVLEEQVMAGKRLRSSTGEASAWTGEASAAATTQHSVVEEEEGDAAAPLPLSEEVAALLASRRQRRATIPYEGPKRTPDEAQDLADNLLIKFWVNPTTSGDPDGSKLQEYRRT